MKGALLFVFALLAFNVSLAAAGSLECTLCELVAKAAETYVAKNATETEIISALDTVCTDLKIFVTQCKGLVGTYAPQIIQSLVNKETPAQICADLTLCSNSTLLQKASDKPQREIGGALECTLCELVAKTAEAYVAKNATEQDIINTLDSLCADLKAPSWVTDCKGIVGTYAPQIIQKLVNQESPAQICADLTLCSNSTLPKQPLPAAKPPQKELQGSLECTLCELVAKAAETYVAKNATETEIITALDTVCTDLKVFVTQCKGLVGTYAPQIIQKLVNKETPAQICAELTLCANKTLESVQGELECGVCTFLVGSAEKYVAQNKTESQILASLEGDCSILKSKSWVATCQGAISTYGPQIIQLVIQKEPADVICTQVGLCKNSTTEPVKVPLPVAPVQVAPVQVAAASNLTCTVCEFLVNAAETFVGQNKTETEIVTLLNDACDEIPIKTWAAACSSMMTEYGSLIIEYVINEEPASVACPELKLCAPSHKFAVSNIKQLFQ